MYRNRFFLLIVVLYWFCCSINAMQQRLLSEQKNNKHIFWEEFAIVNTIKKFCDSFGSGGSDSKRSAAIKVFLGKELSDLAVAVVQAKNCFENKQKELMPSENNQEIEIKECNNKYSNVIGAFEKVYKIYGIYNNAFAANDEKINLSDCESYKFLHNQVQKAADVMINELKKYDQLVIVDNKNPLFNRLSHNNVVKKGSFIIQNKKSFLPSGENNSKKDSLSKDNNLNHGFIDFAQEKFSQMLYESNKDLNLSRKNSILDEEINSQKSQEFSDNEDIVNQFESKTESDKKSEKSLIKENFKNKADDAEKDISIKEFNENKVDSDYKKSLSTQNNEKQEEVVSQELNIASNSDNNNKRMQNDENTEDSNKIVIIEYQQKLTNGEDENTVKIQKKEFKKSDSVEFSQYEAYEDKKALTETNNQNNNNENGYNNVIILASNDLSEIERLNIINQKDGSAQNKNERSEIHGENNQNNHKAGWSKKITMAMCNNKKKLLFLLISGGLIWRWYQQKNRTSDRRKKNNNYRRDVLMQRENAALITVGGKLIPRAWCKK